MHQITYQLALERQDELLRHAGDRRRAAAAQTTANATKDNQIEAPKPSRFRTTIARIGLGDGRCGSESDAIRPRVHPNAAAPLVRTRVRRSLVLGPRRRYVDPRD